MQNLFMISTVTRFVSSIQEEIILISSTKQCHPSREERKNEEGLPTSCLWISARLLFLCPPNQRLPSPPFSAPSVPPAPSPGTDLLSPALPNHLSYWVSRLSSSSDCGQRDSKLASTSWSVGSLPVSSLELLYAFILTSASLSSTPTRFLGL